MLVTIAALAAAAVVVVGSGVSVALVHAANITRFWQAELRRPVGADDIVLVALGDSSMQGVGATSPSHTIAGRVASVIANSTGRQVTIRNHAEGGATVAAILSRQLPHADLERADIILISSANDMERRVDPARYRADAAKLANLLPAAKTAWSDLPMEPGRARYQAILREVADRHGIARADFKRAFRDVRWPNIFSLLPPHLNDRGYQRWAGAFTPAVDAIIANSTELRQQITLQQRAGEL